jgi:hypothetical protein
LNDKKIVKLLDEENILIKNNRIVSRIKNKIISREINFGEVSPIES